MDNAIAAVRARAKPATELRYVFEPPKPDGSYVEVAPGLLWFRMPMPMTLDHINVYLLRDGEGWAVVDTGLGIPKTHELWEHIFGTVLAGQPMTRLICTHCHYDHAGSAAWLQQRFDVPLLMTYGEYMMLRSLMAPPPDPLPISHMDFYRWAGLNDEQIERMFAAMRKDPFMPQPPVSYQRIRPGEVLRIGERDWTVVLGEGHSPEHACLYSEQDKILIAGDQLLPRITSNVMVSPIEPEGDPLKHWIESMHRLRTLDNAALVLPSHQGVYYGVHERVDQVLEHHEMQFELLRSHLHEHGKATAIELMAVLFPRLRSAMDQLMALGETLAHLNFLRHAAGLHRERAAGQPDYFSVAG
ncbi:MBL fold metallo-hydrolase [Comamonas sp.]|uniref:MBL fold metallo-hydrolase n=1 Tax=Comamonas sp. TaxID=34028 RepID=UPI003A94F546